MERSNQPPKTEGCSVEGQIPASRAFDRVERPLGSVPREPREPQARVASGLSNSASKDANASGDAVTLAESKTEATGRGEGAEGLPGSQSVARVEGGTRNWGGPSGSRRTNCESQAGTPVQRQGGSEDGQRGVGSMSNSVGQAMSRDHAKAWTDRRSRHRKPGPYE